MSWSEPEQHGIFYRQRMALASERALIGETTPDENAAREQQRKAQIQVVKFGLWRRKVNPPGVVTPVFLGRYALHEWPFL